MNWNSRSDAVACCNDGYGAVCTGERIARLIHSGISKTPNDPFKRSDIFNSDNKEFSNECGNADGLSVVRCAVLTDAEIESRSNAQAARISGRVPMPTLFASVALLRSIEALGRKGDQVVFIYDDPRPDDRLHAILRGDRSLDRPDQLFIRDRIRDLFLANDSGAIRPVLEFTKCRVCREHHNKQA
jgi:hypothetical protein